MRAPQSRGPGLPWPGWAPSMQTGRACASLATLLSRENDSYIGAPVQLAASFRVIGGNRVRRSVSLGLEASPGNCREVLRDVLDHGERAALRQRQVGSGAAGGIRIAFDAKIGVAEGGHR